MKTKKLQKKIRNVNAKLQKTNKTLLTFFKKTINNYNAMKAKIKSIWLAMAIMLIATATQSCSVTRVVTNESQYYQKGDTAVTIQTKTIETYNAQKH